MAMSGLSAIRGIDYTILIVRDMAAMRRFYAEVMGFPLERTLGDSWIEHRVGSNILALAERSATRAASEPDLPADRAAVQLAFRVARREVDRCAAELKALNVAIIEPPNDQLWGHRTLFFRDPDGNLLEIYAEI